MVKSALPEHRSEAWQRGLDLKRTKGRSKNLAISANHINADKLADIMSGCKLRGDFSAELFTFR